MTDHSIPLDQSELRKAKIMHYLFLITASILCSIYVIFRTLYMIIRMGTDTIMFKKERNEKPEVLKNEEFKHDKVKLSGITLHYAHTGDRSKPLMLFLHGFPEFWYSWRYQLREFSSDYWCVAIDMRGYNLSDKPRGLQNYKMECLTKDVRETVEALGRSSCVLVSHDWGSVVAWATAHKYPEIVDKLIIMNVPHSAAFAKHMREGVSQLLKSWYMFYFQCPYIPEFVLGLRDMASLSTFFRNSPSGLKNKANFTDDDLEAWKYTYGKSGFTAPLNYYRQAMQQFRPPADKGDKKKIVPPTLIIWGTEDVALDACMAEMSLAYCERATLHYVKGASHWVQQDEPKLVNQHMWDFLKGE